MSSPSGMWPNDKRREPRHFFIATVELLEADVQARIRARTGDLSINGCYVDTLNPFPVRSKVKVTITHNEEVFTALGTVAHVEPNIGMGVSFIEVDPKQKEIVLKWLMAARSS
ncbi:MAG TPA: PilZ domain-containing protein [Candidatus Acidoferrum sp.]|nr:PilZ domain-containing protein [Candidatus Acidoferrum sp.]